MPILSVSQAPTKNSNNEDLYVKEVQAEQSITGSSDYQFITLESLEVRREALQKQLDEVNEDIAAINAVKSIGP